MTPTTIAVIGAAGHVGFPYALSLARRGFDTRVIGIDTNTELINQIKNGVIPYIEPGAENLLVELLVAGYIQFTDDPAAVREADIITIMIGTPIDSEGNASVEAIYGYFDYLESIGQIKGKTFILRSTVIPGTSETIINKLHAHGFIPGEDFDLFYCPERVAQHHGLEETTTIPQLIGVREGHDFERGTKFTKALFKAVVGSHTITLTLREAELAKLITNMYRYVNFALANEFYMICANQGVDALKIIRAANENYPRMAMSTPGFAAGPCLYKDGQFLLTEVQYTELIRDAFTINENLVNYLWSRLQDYPHPRRVLILGAAFKPESDDTRNSLSFRFAKILKRNGIEFDVYDPHVKRYSQIPNLGRYDQIVVMTPHKAFRDFLILQRANIQKGTVLADVSKSFTPDTVTGIKVYQ